jgi:hypothetical protein
MGKSSPGGLNDRPASSRSRLIAVPFLRKVDKIWLRRLAVLRTDASYYSISVNRLPSHLRSVPIAKNSTDLPRKTCYKLSHEAVPRTDET